MSNASTSYLPCPICKGIEGCDHPYPERQRASERATATPIYQSRVEGFEAAWRDVSKECYEDVLRLNAYEARIVYEDFPADSKTLPRESEGAAWHMACGDWKDELVAIHGPDGHIASGLTVEQAKAIIAAHGGESDGKAASGVVKGEAG